MDFFSNLCLLKENLFAMLFALLINSNMKPHRLCCVNQFTIKVKKLSASFIVSGQGRSKHLMSNKCLCEGAYSVK